MTKTLQPAEFTELDAWGWVLALVVVAASLLAAVGPDYYYSGWIDCGVGGESNWNRSAPLAWMAGVLFSVLAAAWCRRAAWVFPLIVPAIAVALLSRREAGGLSPIDAAAVASVAVLLALMSAAVLWAALGLLRRITMRSA